LGRPSKIDRLDPALRAEIAAARERGCTIDEIVAKLRELGADLSRSGVGRHVQELDRLGEMLRESRAVAEALVTRFGEAPESRTARLNVELMHSLVMRCLAAQGESAVTLDPEEVMFLARALQSLTSASKADAAVALAVKKELAAELKSKLASLEQDGATGKRTLDPDTLRQVREIYGIAS
jgi:hypothetical protein